MRALLGWTERPVDRADGPDQGLRSSPTSHRGHTALRRQCRAAALRPVEQTSQACLPSLPSPAPQAAASPALHELPATQEPRPAAKQRTRVVVLGSGWAAVSFLKNIDPKMFGGALPLLHCVLTQQEQDILPLQVLTTLPCPAPAEDGPYELTLISPRNYFLFTPLLPSECWRASVQSCIAAGWLGGMRWSLHGRPAAQPSSVRKLRTVLCSRRGVGDGGGAVNCGAHPQPHPRQGGARLCFGGCWPLVCLRRRPLSPRVAGCWALGPACLPAQLLGARH